MIFKNMQLENEKKEWLGVLRAIGKVTCQEMLREKILYNIILFALLLLGLGYLVSFLSFLRPVRIILDFGYSAINLACAFIAIFGGANLISRELERRTVQSALSRPITWGQFLVGKIFGLIIVLFLNWSLLSLVYLMMVKLSIEGWDVFHSTLFVGLFLIFIQSILLSSLAVFFSTFTTTSLSVIFSIAFYLIGNNVSQFRFMAEKTELQSARFFLSGLSALLPNLEYFNLGARFTYGLPIGWSYFLFAVFYGLLFTLIALLISSFVIQVRKMT